MFNDGGKLKGRVGIKLIDESGNIKHEQDVNNLVVNNGLNFILEAMNGDTSDIMDFIAIGSGTSSAAAGDTALQTEVTRVQMSSRSIASNVISFSASYGAGVGTATISEAGIFDAASAGDMLCRVQFGSIVKEAADSLVINWDLTLTAS